MAGLLDAERFDSAANVAADIDFMSGSGSPDGTPRRSLSHTASFEAAERVWMLPVPCDAVLNSAHASPASKGGGGGGAPLGPPGSPTEPKPAVAAGSRLFVATSASALDGSKLDVDLAHLFTPTAVSPKAGDAPRSNPASVGTSPSSQPPRRESATSEPVPETLKGPEEGHQQPGQHEEQQEPEAEQQRQQQHEGHDAPCPPSPGMGADVEPKTPATGERSDDAPLPSPFNRAAAGMRDADWLLQLIDQQCSERPSVHDTPLLTTATKKMEKQIQEAYARLSPEWRRRVHARAYEYLRDADAQARAQATPRSAAKRVNAEVLVRIGEMLEATGALGAPMEPGDSIHASSMGFAAAIEAAAAQLNRSTPAAEGSCRRSGSRADSVASSGREGSRYGMGADSCDMRMGSVLAESQARRLAAAAPTAGTAGGQSPYRQAYGLTPTSAPTGAAAAAAPSVQPDAQPAATGPNGAAHATPNSSSMIQQNQQQEGNARTSASWAAQVLRASASRAAAPPSAPASAASSTCSNRQGAGHNRGPAPAAPRAQPQQQQRLPPGRLAAQQRVARALVNERKGLSGLSLDLGCLTQLDVDGGPAAWGPSSAGHAPKAQGAGGSRSRVSQAQLRRAQQMNKAASARGAAGASREGVGGSGTVRALPPWQRPNEGRHKKGLETKRRADEVKAALEQKKRRIFEAAAQRAAIAAAAAAAAASATAAAPQPTEQQQPQAQPHPQPPDAEARPAEWAAAPADRPNAKPPPAAGAKANPTGTPRGATYLAAYCKLLRKKTGVFADGQGGPVSPGRNARIGSAPNVPQRRTSAADVAQQSTRRAASVSPGRPGGRQAQGQWLAQPPAPQVPHPGGRVSEGGKVPQRVSGGGGGGAAAAAYPTKVLPATASKPYHIIHAYSAGRMDGWKQPDVLLPGMSQLPLPPAPGHAPLQTELTLDELLGLSALQEADLGQGASSNQEAHAVPPSGWGGEAGAAAAGDAGFTPAAPAGDTAVPVAVDPGAGPEQEAGAGAERGGFSGLDVPEHDEPATGFVIVSRRATREALDFGPLAPPAPEPFSSLLDLTALLPEPAWRHSPGRESEPASMAPHARSPSGAPRGGAPRGDRYGSLAGSTTGADAPGAQSPGSQELVEGGQPACRTRAASGVGMNAGTGTSRRLQLDPSRVVLADREQIQASSPVRLRYAPATEPTEPAAPKPALQRRPLSQPPRSVAVKATRPVSQPRAKPAARAPARRDAQQQQPRARSAPPSRPGAQPRKPLPSRHAPKQPAPGPKAAAQDQEPQREAAAASAPQGASAFAAVPVVKDEESRVAALRSSGAPAFGSPRTPTDRRLHLAAAEDMPLSVLKGMSSGLAAAESLGQASSVASTAAAGVTATTTTAAGAVGQPAATAGAPALGGNTLGASLRSNPPLRTRSTHYPAAPVPQHTKPAPSGDSEPPSGTGTAEAAPPPTSAAPYSPPPARRAAKTPIVRTTAASPGPASPARDPTPNILSPARNYDKPWLQSPVAAGPPREFSTPPRSRRVTASPGGPRLGEGGCTPPNRSRKKGGRFCYAAVNDSPGPHRAVESLPEDGEVALGSPPAVAMSRAGGPVAFTTATSTDLYIFDAMPSPSASLQQHPSRGLPLEPPRQGAASMTSGAAGPNPSTPTQLPAATQMPAALAASPELPLALSVLPDQRRTASATPSAHAPAVQSAAGLPQDMPRAAAPTQDPAQAPVQSSPSLASARPRSQGGSSGDSNAGDSNALGGMSNAQRGSFRGTATTLRAGPSVRLQPQEALIRAAGWQGHSEPRVSDALAALQVGVLVHDPSSTMGASPNRPLLGPGRQQVASPDHVRALGCMGFFGRRPAPEKAGRSAATPVGTSSSAMVLLKAQLQEGTVQLVLTQQVQQQCMYGSLPVQAELSAHLELTGLSAVHPDVRGAAASTSQRSTGQRPGISAAVGGSAPGVRARGVGTRAGAEGAQRWVEVVVQSGEVASVLRLIAGSPADHARLVLGLNAALALVGGGGMVAGEDLLSGVPIVYNS